MNHSIAPRLSIKNFCSPVCGRIIALGQQTMPAIARYNGTGGPGCFLEDLIGLRAGNQDIADIIGWEVK